MIQSPASSSFQSTRPLRSATSPRRTCGQGRRSFNPRAPCGARLKTHAFVKSLSMFQSTRPLRSATYASMPRCIVFGVSIHAPLAERNAPWHIKAVHEQRFNPRAPCGARHTGRKRTNQGGSVSIHAPLAERDCLRSIDIYCPRRFNPRAPCGARLEMSNTAPIDFSFNPRASCGARPYWTTRWARTTGFQSTRPLRSATGD